MRRLPIALTAALVVLVPACTSDTDTSTTTTSASADSADTALADRLQETIDSLHGEIGFPPGIVARVVGPDGEWTGTAGVAGVDDQRPPTPEDHTRVAVSPRR